MARHFVQSLARACVLVGSLALGRDASAAPSYTDRSLTLPRLVFAGNPGLGVAHTSLPGRDFTGAGLNLEGAIGVTDSVELGLRTGIRLGNDGKVVRADSFGRTLFTETYGVGGDAVANPELRVRWAAHRGRVVELGLDGRFFMPVETGTRAGIMFGVPLAFHLGHVLRIDTGLYLPVSFTDPTSVAISVPGYFWFQVSHSVWLGPMVGLRHIDPGGPNTSHDDFLLGFGLGYQVASAVDLKWMILSPRVNGNRADERPFGAGFGVEFRIGE